MHQNFEIAKIELNSSLKLTRKPFLSIFHLLDISQHDGDDKTSLALLKQANEMLPSNTLVRNRFIEGLEPRWGGSYEQMKDFIKKSKAEGVSAVGIWQLMAITYDDMGFTLMEHGDTGAAIENFLKALELGQRVGGEFRKDFLSHSCYYSCREPALKKYCQ
jgi:tetratricopeptide (TPR) repeat protein